MRTKNTKLKNIKNILTVCLALMFSPLALAANSETHLEQMTGDWIGHCSGDGEVVDTKMELKVTPTSININGEIFNITTRFEEFRSKSHTSYLVDKIIDEKSVNHLLLVREYTSFQHNTGDWLNNISFKWFNKFILQGERIKIESFATQEGVFERYDDCHLVRSSKE